MAADPDDVAEAIRAREKDPPEAFDSIADRFGVSVNTIHRWTNPERAERDRATSRAWKDRNRAANRQRDRIYSLEYEDKRRARRKPRKTPPVKATKTRTVREERILNMAQQGMTPERIAAVVGSTAKQVNNVVATMRGQR